MIDKTGELHKSSHLHVFKIGVLKNSVIFTGKHVLVYLFNKVSGLRCLKLAASEKKT